MHTPFQKEERFLPTPSQPFLEIWIIETQILAMYLAVFEIRMKSPYGEVGFET